MISYLSLPGESSKSTFQIRLKKKKNPQTVDNTSKSFGRRPHPRNKDILLYSITKGPRDHHITKDYSNHLAFRLANFGKMHKILTSNLIVLCVCVCVCAYTSAHICVYSPKKVGKHKPFQCCSFLKCFIFQLLNLIHYFFQTND